MPSNSSSLIVVTCPVISADKSFTSVLFVVLTIYYLTVYRMKTFDLLSVAVKEFVDFNYPLSKQDYCWITGVRIYLIFFRLFITATYLNSRYVYTDEII